MTATKQIPFFNYPALYKSDERELEPLILDVLRRGAYIMQRDLLDFETALAKYLGVEYAIGMADGTLAITIGLMCAGVKPGDEVIVPSHTFVATASAIVHVGAKPVLVDCREDHIIDPASVEAAVTPKTKAILPVQLNGRTADMHALLTIAARHNLKIVEDSCQALGSKFGGKFAGTFGTAGAFSFYPSKTLGCFGDGGALVTNDIGVAKRARELRDHGRGEDGIVRQFGFNARLDNLQAAVLSHRLKSYPQAIARRRKIAAIYDQRLRSLEEILLPPPPTEDGDHYDIFQNYEIEVERRTELRQHLLDQGIGTILQWGGNCIHQFSDLGLVGNCPYSEKMSHRFMLLPLNLSLSDDDVHYVADKIISFYRG